MNDMLVLFVKYFTIAIAAALVLGFLLGIITYGKPVRRKKNDKLIDHVMNAGIEISHGLIDIILFKARGNKTRGQTWMDDQGLLKSIQSQTPTEFEHFTADLFRKMGYRAEVVGGASDGGIDIRMKKDGRRHVVQCKKFVTRKVRPHDVRDFFGAMGAESLDGKGFFVTTNVFTLEAERFAEDKPLELIDGQTLIKLVRETRNDHAYADKNASGKGAHNAVTDRERASECPKCGKKLALRVYKKTGDKFWGCTGFPKCRFTKPAN